ncbi:hypothetical protein [Xylocopilactobacillus apis]|uniref:hypothetical protein n=1 Tax=Xylocopilactobacillus apis TaxID=2932183 RepID=UPI0029533FE7|nr:hypothetical protein [Xylocopilactobacillus apis]
MGTSGAQSWYYQLFPKTYVFSFFDIFTHFKLFDYLLLFYIVLEFILTIKTQNTNEYLFHVGLLFIYLSYFFDRWLYAIFSSTTKTDFIALVLFSSTFGYLFNLLVHKGKETESSTKNSFSIFLVSIICISCFAISQINLSKEVINTYATRAENGVYYKNLGGYLSNDGVSLYAGVPGVSDEGFDTLIDKTKGKNFFSTYSSALEVINNKFSKSHEDYIIHALGPKAQKNYLKNFQKNNYNVFLTPSIKSSLGYYEWIINSNWYFFKYIFEHYHYVDTHSYADIWRKDNKNRIISSKYSILTQKIKVTVMEGVSDITGIEIKTSKKINGIASLKIKYKVVDQTFGTIHSNIGIISALPDEFAGKAGSSYFNLPIKGEYEIPVYLNNGKGVALLFPFPQNKSNLIIESTKISEIIKYDYKNISNQ